MTEWVNVEDQGHPEKPGVYYCFFPGYSNDLENYSMFAISDYYDFALYQGLDLFGNPIWNTNTGSYSEDIIAYYGPLELPEYEG